MYKDYGTMSKKQFILHYFFKHPGNSNVIIKAVLKILIKLSEFSGEFLHCKSVPPVKGVAFKCGGKVLGASSIGSKITQANIISNQDQLLLIGNYSP